MTRWVTLLRGVNVNGITVRSADLADCLRAAGLRDVRTVLATGNATFTTAVEATAVEGTAVEATAPDLVDVVQGALRERFGYQAWVIVLAADDLAALAAGYPFARRDATHHPYLVFVADDATHADLARRTAALEAGAGAGEQWELRPAACGAPGVVYWECPKGSSTDTPLARVLAAARYRPSTTTRTLRTVEAIVTAASTGATT